MCLWFSVCIIAEIKLQLSSCLCCPHNLGLQAYVTTPRILCGHRKTWIQVLMLVQEALLPTEPSPQTQHLINELNKYAQNVIVLISFQQLDTNVGISEKRASWDNASVKCACRQIFEVLSSLMINVGGPSPLWALLFLGFCFWLVKIDRVSHNKQASK